MPPAGETTPTKSMSVSDDVTGEPITITLVPVGVEKDPGRVARASEAFHDANAKARDALRALVNAFAPGGDPHERALAYYDGRRALTACDDAQEEFLCAVAGVPARGGR